MRLRVLGGTLAAIATITGGLASPALGEDALDVAARADAAFARAQLAATVAALSPTAYPHRTDAAGRWVTTAASAWTSGFLPGSLWLAYQGNADPVWRTRAERSQAGVQSQQYNTSTHDVGFIINNSYGNAYRLTGVDAYRQVVLRAAQSLATRYNPTVGCIRSWNTGTFPVIVDNMMNLEILFWASKHGGSSSLYNIAVSHALKTRANHVRPDGSTYHVVDYNPSTGAVTARRTHQGYSDSSTWARGQAWAIHGFAIAYRETGDARFLDTARRTADWFLARLPADQVPYWDFDAPGIPSEPRDSSAAAIAASGLLQLAALEPDASRAATYAQRARGIVTALSSPAYLAAGTGSSAILLHGTSNRPGGIADSGLVYGDYYLVEALLRLRRLAPTGPALPVSAVRASASDGNVPANAIDGKLSTRWSAQGDGQWIELDLGAQRPITKATVAAYLGNQRTSRFELQTSTDRTTWQPRGGFISSGATLSAETYDVPDHSARYVRLVGHGNSTGTWSSYTEIRVH